MCMCVNVTRGDHSAELLVTMMKYLVNAVNRGGCTCPSYNGKLLHLPTSHTHTAISAEGVRTLYEMMCCSV